MSIQPSHHKPPVHGPNPSDDGTLGRAAALGFAIALGLLKGLGVSYSKIIQAGNAAQKALADLLAQINALEKFAKAKDTPAERAKFKAAIEKLVKDLETIMHLTSSSHEWNKDFPKQGAALRKKLEAFLKHLISQVGGAFEGWPGKGDDYMKQFIDGKHAFNWNKFFDQNWQKWWSTDPAKRADIFTGLFGKLQDAATYAQTQFAKYQTQWAYTRKRIENWIQVSEKSVQIQAKTAQFQISKI